MFRQTLLCVLSATGFAVFAGCDTSTHEDRRADIARAGLMPGAAPLMSSIYTQNQSEVKLSPERTISYEPLESFRGQTSPTGKTVGKHAKASGKSKHKSTNSEKGPIGKLKQMFSGIIKYNPGATGAPTVGGDHSPGMGHPEHASSSDNADDEGADEDEGDDEDDGDEDEDDAADDEEEDEEDDAADDEDDDDEADEDDGDDAGNRPGSRPRRPARRS